MSRKSLPIRQTAPGFAFVSLDRTAPASLYQQIYEAVREAILTGRMAPGTMLPSTRALAEDLGVSRNTVLNAFEQLFSEGYVVGKVGSGSFVASDLPEDCVAARSPDAAAVHDDDAPPGLSRRGTALIGRTTLMAGYPGTGLAFSPATPALDAFPFEAWSRLMARTRPGPARSRLGYPDPGGYGPLRKAIAEYLRQSRGVACTAEQVVLFCGTQLAIDFFARLLTEAGDSAWLEDPGYLGAQAALAGAGLRLRGVRVDGDGLDWSDTARAHPAPKLLYLTPSHQFPTGVTMSLARRLLVLDWARSNGVWILEDDYDSEYRYSGRPLASLQGLDRGSRVIYLGTFSKVLFPSLRLSYAVVPERLVDDVLRARIADTPPLFEQMVLTDFLTEGHFARHLRRMRTLYARRQERLLVAAGRYLRGRLEVQRSEAGMYVVGTLPAGLSDIEVTRVAGAAGLNVQPLSPFYLDCAARQGLILGYACVDDPETTAAVIRLARAIDTMAGA